MINISDFYNFIKNLGIGFTPIRRLPNTINPFNDKIPIYVKLEYLNFGESVKSRPFAMIYYIKKITGLMNYKERVITATSGNFGLAGSYILPNNLDFTVLMSRKTVDENKTLIKKLIRNNVKVDVFSDSYCPALGAKRGQAIAFARELEKIDEKIINFDQYDDIGNPLSHFITTGPEIYLQTNRKIKCFIAGLGTCGTIVGAGHFLKRFCNGTWIIGLVPQEEHHQLGLRSRDELKASKFFLEAKRICDDVIEVSDKNAMDTMLKLWNIGIPAGISGGTNCFGALKIAEKMYKIGYKGVIVTLIPDSLENYENFLHIHLHNIIGESFLERYKIFKYLKTRVRMERERHVSTVKLGKISIFNDLKNLLYNIIKTS